MKTPFLVYTRRAVLSHQINVPEGSGIHVSKVLKRSYRGIWASMMGSYTVTVPKDAARTFTE